jgi:tRNA-specific 2-thiouridylase
VQVLVAMSGGVDSAVAAALLRDAGHEVVGVTLKLWGGPSDSGCCSVADVEDARTVARRLGIEHHVFNMAGAFEDSVVEPYVAAHAAGETPNPCIECNRHIKFGVLLERARRLGFDLLATGHHARVVADPATGRRSLRRGYDRAKDQSYVLSMLTEAELSQVAFPVGELAKRDVRLIAAAHGLEVAGKPDSQDVCFVASRSEAGARARFVGERARLHEGRVVEAGTGAELGRVPAVELVTIGQRRGLGAAGGSGRRYVLSVDVATATVVVGEHAGLLTDEVRLVRRTWAHAEAPPGTQVEVQASAHGSPRPAVLTDEGARLLEPAPRVAPGQTVALYAGDEVLGSGVAA